MFFLLDGLWAQRGRNSDTRVIAGIVAWALLDDYEADGWTACPTHRIVTLHAILRSEGPPATADVRTNFQAWSARTGLSQPFQTLRKRADRRDATARRVRALVSADKIGARLAKDINTCITYIMVASARMSAAFEAEPDAYIWPDRYVDEIGRFERPLLRCEFDTFRVAAPKGSSLKKEWFPLFTQRNGAGQEALRTGMLKLDLPGTPVDDYARVLRRCTFSC